MRRLISGACAVALTVSVGCDERPKPAAIDTDTGAVGLGSTSAPASAATSRPLAEVSATAADLRHLELLRAAAERDADSEAAQMRLAHHCVKLSRWKDAREAVDAALALDPDHADAKRLERYLPELQAASTVAARRELEMKMASESLIELGERLEGAGSLDAMNRRRDERVAELRERFGMTDDMLRAQQPGATAASLRLNQTLKAIAEPAAKEAHIRKALDAEPTRLDAWIALLDLLIEQRRYDAASREVAVARRGSPGDLVLRLYEHHLDSLVSAAGAERTRDVVATLQRERLTLMTMISEAKIGRLSR